MGDNEWPLDLSKHKIALEKASRELESLQTQHKALQLVATLKNGDDAFLLAHAQKFLQYEQRVQTMEADLAREKEEQAEREAEAVSIAQNVKPQIFKGIAKQMKWDPVLKYSTKQIRYELTKVSALVFQKAFGLEEGVTSTKIEGDEVPHKYLRYGASLVCSTISVEHHGSLLIALGTIHMEK